jgi:hypothetical protein
MRRAASLAFGLVCVSFGAAAGASCTKHGDGSAFEDASFGPPIQKYCDASITLGSSGSGSGGTGILTDGVACGTGLQCDVVCGSGGTTTISGKVYDPAGKNPLFGVAVYVPASALSALPRGVPTGDEACACGALFESGALVNTTTAVDGTFVLGNAPVGASVPLVLQVGKWRRVLEVKVEACQGNPQADRSLTLPGAVKAGSDDSMPDIAVSTGYADTLECLLSRVGVDDSEYVAGASSRGHVHIFSGGAGPMPSSASSVMVGANELTPMAGAPASDEALWDQQADLMPYDVVLLSCEGGETYDANPAVLEAYLNAGGRVFASHYHYAWFAGPLATSQGYAAPADWGSDLATWSAELPDGSTLPAAGVIDQTLNVGAGPFPKGVILASWLEGLGALGGDGAPPRDLPIYAARFNASVGPSNPASQPWITLGADAGEAATTMYFSFDTPVGAPAALDGGPPSYCGRAVFSDLHVSGNPKTTDDLARPPPSSCAHVALSPQEKALEFMLFDLSSCVVADSVAVSADAGLPPPLK